MMGGALLAVACYLVVAISPYNLLSLVACALCGFGVSLLWPGTLVIAAEKYPLAGAWLFAILAAGGDIGASIGPWMMGVVTEHAPRWAPVAGLAANLGLSLEQIGLRWGCSRGLCCRSGRSSACAGSTLRAGLPLRQSRPSQLRALKIKRGISR